MGPGAWGGGSIWGRMLEGEPQRTHHGSLFFEMFPSQVLRTHLSSPCEPSYGLLSPSGEKPSYPLVRVPPVTQASSSRCPGHGCCPGRVFTFQNLYPGSSLLGHLPRLRHLKNNRSTTPQRCCPSDMAESSVKHSFSFLAHVDRGN